MILNYSDPGRGGGGCTVYSLYILYVLYVLYVLCVLCMCVYVCVYMGKLGFLELSWIQILKLDIMI
jgi:hypothetical protein